jgi:translation initiation factor IF-2
MKDKEKNLNSRPPVVVILGHVDHGKSSILEAIKGLKILERESGGITQHIGAYEVEHSGKKITFIDTPGHEAFSSMRARGARVADVAVLVVAADEGVKPQTEEAIEHIKKAGIPMIVALNKIDKAGANPDRITQQLAEKEVYLESLGGKVPSCLVSAKEKKGLEDLLEIILLVSEIEELKADFSVPASGIIVESHLDSFKGPTATLIVEAGTLEKGDIVATKSACGRIKAMEDSQGGKTEKVTPSMPALVYGFEEVPFVGEKFQVFHDLDSAKKFLGGKECRDFLKKETKGEEKVNLVLKADFFGSLEAIEGILQEIPQERVSLNIIKAEVGDINESDIKTAKSAQAEIIGFKVKIKPGIAGIAERDNVRISLFDIIYEIVERTRKLMEKMINPRIERTDLGKVKVMALFLKNKKSQILGCKVLQGEIRKNSMLEVLRANPETKEEEIIGKGKVVNLKKGEKETEKVFQGEECGILYEGNVRIEEQDVLSAYVEEEEDITGIV